MSLPLEQEWVLVVSGLIAHADGVLEAEECDRLLGILGNEVPPEVYSEWLTFFSDHAALTRRYESMHNPTPGAAPKILQQAWAMALVDGEEAEAEVKVLKAIGERIGVSETRIDNLRPLWDAELDAFAETTAEAASWILSGGGPLPEADRDDFARFVDRLPTQRDHREELRAMLVLRSQAGQGEVIAKFDPAMRDQCLRLLAPLVHDASDEDAARERYLELAGAAGMSAEVAGRVLEATR